MFVSLVIPWRRYWSLGSPRGKSRDVSVASYEVMDSNNNDCLQQEQNHHSEGQGQPERRINNYISNVLD